ncbi:MAG: glycosyltransferase family 4 protein [Sphaerospermopsis kisseleviana]
MKIAFIHYSYPPDIESGGITTYVRQAANMLQNRGNLVEVFAESYHRSGVEIEASGVRIHRIQVQNGKLFSNEIAPVFAERHAVVKFDVLEGPDFGADAAGAIRLVPEIPLVVKLHTPHTICRQVQTATIREPFSKLRPKLGAFHQWLNPRSIENIEKNHAHDADVIAAPSNLIGKLLIKQWKLDRQKVQIFPLPYIPSPETLSIPIEQKASQVVTFVGRLEIRKGVLELAQAIPDILKHCPDAKFRFVGQAMQSPNPKQNMQEYLEKLLHPYCHSLEFIGQVPNSQISFILSQTDVCIFPSLFDSVGLVCLDAMAAGRAVIGSIASGMVEIINTDSVGRLVSPNSPQQITQSTIELLQNPELRVQIGIAARERILQEYNLERIGDLQEKSYQVAIETRQRLGTRRKFSIFV